MTRDEWAAEVRRLLAEAHQSDIVPEMHFCYSQQAMNVPIRELGKPIKAAKAIPISPGQQYIRLIVSIDEDELRKLNKKNGEL